jgi:hypothetical protein
MTIEEVLGRFEGVRREGEGWKALCPAHDDHDPSLSIAGREDRVLIHCFAGCRPDDVVARVGLLMGDLFLSDDGQPVTVASLAADKCLPVEFLETLGLRDLPAGGVGIPYYDANGAEQLTRIRTALKAGDGSSWPKGSTPTVYGANRLAMARKAGELVLVEGESDCWTAWHHGLACLGVPGAGLTSKIELGHLDGISTVYVVEEPDDGGRRFVEAVAERCRVFGWPGKLLRVRIPDGLKDVNALHCDDAARFRERLVAAMAAATPLRARQLGFTPLGELLREPPDRRRWVAANMLPAGGTSLVVSKPKVGKSTLVRSLAFAVARGTPWLGRATERGTVLYCTFEENRDQFRRAWSAMGATGDEPIKVFCDRAPGVDAVAWLRDAIERERPALVVIDTLFKFVRVKDVSAYAEVYKALEPLIDLARDTGTHILVVHHSPKGERGAGDEALGSTAILGSVDTMLTLRRTEHHRTVRSIQRYGVDLDETTLLWDEGTQTVSAGPLLAVAALDRVKKQICDFLTGRDPARETDILGAVQGRNQDKVKALRQLVDDRKVGRDGSGNRNDPFRYFYMSIATDLVSHSLLPLKGGVVENEFPDACPRVNPVASVSHSLIPTREPSASGMTGMSNGAGNERNDGNEGNEQRRDESPSEPAA